jgi:radical SAM protein with 4Fe4S-binding SPASM domain
VASLNYLRTRLELLIFLQRFAAHRKKYGSYPPPSYVLWDCTRRCNLNCRHCGASKETYGNELTTEQVKGFLNELAAMRVKFFAVTGGEPTLRTDLIEVLSHAGVLGIRTGIASNGFLIDAAKARQLKEAGLSSIQISLDGTEDVHNSIRGNPQSYRRAVDAVRHCREAGIPMITVATVVTRFNKDNIPDLLPLLLELGVRHWKVIPLMPIGRADKGEAGVDTEALRQVLKFISVIRKRINVIIGENLPYLGRYDAKARNAVTFCPVGFTACCLGVDGNVRGCPEMPDTAENMEGSILQRPFARIWQEGFARYRERILRNEDCRGCRLWNRCYGGCWVMRLDGSHCIRDWKL